MSVLNVGPNATNPSYVTDGVADDVQINAAISDAIAGDVIKLEKGSFDITESLAVTKSLTIHGAGIDITTLTGNALFPATGIVSVNGGVNGMNLVDFSVDGNGREAVNESQGVTMRNGSNHNLDFIKVTDTRGHQVGVYGCNNVAINDLITRTDTGISGTSHGLDIDLHDVAPAGPGVEDINSTNITITRGDLDNRNNGQATKAENCSGVEYIDTIFNGDVIAGDGVATGDVGVTYTRPVFNGELRILLRNAAEDINVVDPEFTENAGVVSMLNNSGTPLVLQNPVFLGMNAVIGWDGVNFFTPTNYTATNVTHNKPQRVRTLFASYNDTGAPGYNTRPYLTPDTARNSLENLVEDAGINDPGTYYALLSGYGEQVPSGSNISPIVSGEYHIEGSPGIAVVNASQFAADFIASANFTAGSTINKLQIKGGNIAGTQAIRMIGGNVVCDQVEIQDYVSGAQPVEVRGGASLIMYRSSIHDCGLASGSTVDGYAAYVRDAGSVFKLLGGRIYNNIGRGGAVRATDASDVDLSCTVMHNNTSNGTIGHLFLQNSGAINLDNMTIIDSAGSDDDVYVSGLAAITLNNAILPDAARLGGTATYTLAGCLINGGIGSHTDGGGNIDGVPTYQDAADEDYSLAAGSPGVGAGVKWWGDNPRPVGVSGEPFPDFDIDIGAYQSTHSPHHPVNLFAGAAA